MFRPDVEISNFLGLLLAGIVDLPLLMGRESLLVAGIDAELSFDKELTVLRPSCFFFFAMMNSIELSIMLLRCNRHPEHKLNGTDQKIIECGSTTL